MRYGDDANSCGGGKDGGVITVPVTTGSFGRTHTVPHGTTFDLPLDSRLGPSPYRCGKGGYDFNGSLGFELTDPLCAMIFNENLHFFKRRNFLDIEISDGEGRISIPGCVWSSFTLDAQPCSLVTGSLSFSTCNGYKDDIQYSGSNATTDAKDIGDLAKYWQYGESGLESFTLNCTRSVTPVHLNESKWCGPSYLRVGLLDVSLDCKCLRSWTYHKSIRLGSRTLALTDAFISSKSISFSDSRGQGSRSYTYQALGKSGADSLFTVTKK